MARAQVPFFSLNTGEIDKAVVNRIDLEKMRMAAETMVNWMPLVRGPMTMRPGTKYLGSTRNDARTKLIPFIFNASTTSLVEVSEGAIRVRNSDQLVSYPNYSTVVTNGTFDAAIGTGWTNVSTTGASATISGGDLVLSSTTYSYGRARQTVSVSSGDTDVLHAIKIEVRRGPVTFRVGRTAGGQEVISNQKIETGTHYIAFKPGATTIYLEFEGNEKMRGTRSVASCQFVKNQVMELAAPWAEADIENIRFSQSGSIIFIACKGYKQYQLERRGANSWGLAEYKTVAGPYLTYAGNKIRLKASSTRGNVTLTSSQPFFTPGMVGSVFEVATGGQRRTELFTAVGQSTGAIKVTGVGGLSGTARAFTYSVTYSGGATGTVWLEWSYGTPDNWSRAYGAYTDETATSSGTYDVNDAKLRIYNPDSGPTQLLESNDNAVVYYRLTTTSSNSTGTISASIDYNGGNQVGVVRITGYTSPTSVTAEVISELGKADKWTDDWRQGAWGTDAGWPSSVAFHDGRLWWAGFDKVWGSVSDDFYNFDPNTIGDAGPINRSVALGPVEGIHWLLSSQRLLVGTASAEVSVRSNTIDEPITPTKFTARNASTLGSANVQAQAIDSTGIFVQRSGSKVFELGWDVQINDYNASELTRINHDICSPGISSFAIQRQPDTRAYFVKDDGTMALLLYSRADEVVGWSRIETDGTFESICVLPTGEDDDVYAVVRRRINGIDRRYVEKLATTAETTSGASPYLLDSTVAWSAGSPTTAVTGLTHLAGKEVVVFATAGGFEAESFLDDAFQSQSSLIIERHTVGNDGTITLATALSAAIIGLPYTAQFKSVKLAYASQGGTALTQKKRVNHLAVVGINIAVDGLRIGRDFDNMTKLGNVYKGRPIETFQVFDDWDYDATTFGGKYDSDSRVCIENVSPYPATISGVVISLETNDRG